MPDKGSVESTRHRENTGPVPELVERMFSRIARRYDLMNTLMTGGRDRSWRRLAVKLAQPEAAVALDVGAGTGELSNELLRQGARYVVGIDFSREMLAAAKAKAEAFCGEGGTARSRVEDSANKGSVHAPRRADTEVSRPSRPRIGIPRSGTCTGRPFAGGVPRAGTGVEGQRYATGAAFLAGDALNLPFAEGSFDAVISGFVVRNLADRTRGFEEMRRVVRPGGRVVCLEITHPPSRVFARLFRLYFDRLVPLLGSVVTGDVDAYRYLPNSLRLFPNADGLARIMEEAWLKDVNYRLLGGGTVAIHYGYR